MNQKESVFSQMPIKRAVWKLAFPSILGQIILVIYNMADTFFVSLTKSDQMITAVAISAPAFMMLSAIANLFGIGCGGVIARMMGGKEKEKASAVTAFGIFTCLLFSVIYSFLIFLFLDPFVDFLGGLDEAVHIHTCRYLLVTVVFGGCITCMNNLFAHLFRAEGYSFEAGTGIILGGVLNMILDPLFMFVILPTGNEAFGAGIATALSNLISLSYFLLLQSRKDMILSFKPQKELMDSSVLRDIFATGLPACVMTLCENLSFIVMDHILSFVSVAVQAGIGVAKKINMLAHCIVRGISQGVLPLIAYNYASGYKQRMKDSLLYSLFVAILLSSACMAGCELFAAPLVGIFVPQGESFLFGIKFLRILSLGAPFSACAYILISFFQAVGKGKSSLLLALMRKGILDIPMMYGILFFFERKQVVWATPLTDLLCCICAVVLLNIFLKKEKLLS